jgi:hypothetical protein
LVGTIFMQGRGAATGGNGGGQCISFRMRSLDFELRAKVPVCGVFRAHVDVSS